MKKKLLTLLLAGAMLTAAGAFGIAGCGTNETDNGNKEEQPSHTHVYENYVYDNNATCTEDGTETAKCTGCDKTDTRTKVGSKTGHKYAYTPIDANSHKYECSVCHDSIDEQHTFSDYKCTKCGYTVKTSEGLEFTLSQDGKTYTVTGIGTCTDEELLIPSLHNGLPVTKLDMYDGPLKDLISNDYAAETYSEDNEEPNEDEDLENYRRLNGIKKIIIPDSITEIAQFCFAFAFDLEEVIVGKNVKTLDYTFYYCNSLNKINLPDGLTSIGNYAFFGCSTLTGVNIPNSLEKINDCAFMECYALTSIIIPDNVKSVGDCAFMECYALTNLNIGKGIKAIGNSVFRLCTSLTSITIPDSVTSIGDRAFKDCTSITSISIPDSVTSIDGRAFNGCTSITSISIPDGVTSIGDRAFYGCSKLTSIIIPDKVTSIDNYALGSCSSLTNITFKGTKSQWIAITKLNDWNYNSGNFTIQCTDGKLDKDGNEIE